MPGSFIVNLCALPSAQRPPQPQTTESSDLRFFVSRRTGEGGDRFYLHVGFFPTRAESERWRDIFRPEYPNAFVSRLSSQTPVVKPETTALSETEQLRVLEVRAPRRDQALAETGSYTVTAEARLPQSQGQSSLTTTPVARSTPTPVATNTTARPEKSTRDSRDLADELRDLAATGAREHNDLSRTTGVRHLRIEFVRKPKRAAKPTATRRRRGH